MTKIIILLYLLSFFSFANLNVNEMQNYETYHLQVIEAEQLIASENYSKALQVYEQLFKEYHFVFLREYQVATQLALYLGDMEKAKEYLKKGMLAGWELKSIKKNKSLSALRSDVNWRSIKKEYPVLHNQYESTLNQKIRGQVKKMYSKDQSKAIKALFKFSSKSQDNYAEKKFAPHSEKQIAEFSAILETYGYPGEQLIGNTTWMSTILSHHNSISTAYCEKDTLYPNLKPKLKDALQNGEISPQELAAIDDWYLSVKYDRTKPTYGILDPPSPSYLSKTNELRKKIYLRSVQLRDSLTDIQKETGMNFYLTDRWY
jgi:hypothetical protein